MACNSPQGTGRPALKTLVDGHSKLILEVERPASAAQSGVPASGDDPSIELPSTTDDTSCCIQHSLEPVSGVHWRLGQNENA